MQDKFKLNETVTAIPESIFGTHGKYVKINWTGEKNRNKDYKRIYRRKLQNQIIFNSSVFILYNRYQLLFWSSLYNTKRSSITWRYSRYHKVLSRSKSIIFCENT